jgi:hypothetical protein
MIRLRQGKLQYRHPHRNSFETENISPSSVPAELGDLKKNLRNE